MQIQQFRQAVYQSLQMRADATMDLIDALTVAGHVTSPVGLSEMAPFRRTHSMVYDCILHGQWQMERLRELLSLTEPPEAERLAGYAVYAVDATENERAEAHTLQDRGILKADQFDALRFGHKYSWVVRLVHSGTSWTAPIDIKRVGTTDSETRVAAEQVAALARRQTEPKVITADSLYANEKFLPIVSRLHNTYVLVRMRRNSVLYERPAPPQQPKRGRPARHGARFELSHPACQPDREEQFDLDRRLVRVQAWTGLHFKKMPDIEATAVCIWFLHPDGKPFFEHPVWLFWTGPETVSLQNLCKMYLWRFAIEHTFRFLKQHLGLNANRSTNLVSTERWMWLCALAYWQLLLMRNEVDHLRPTWYPHRNRGLSQHLTPGLVQRQALTFLLRLGSPAASVRPSGKGLGRKKGFRPTPKPRFRIVKKSQPAANSP